METVGRRAFQLRGAPPLTHSITHYHHCLKKLRPLESKWEKVVKILGLRQQAVDSVQGDLLRQAESQGTAAYRILDVREQDLGVGGVSLILEKRPLSILFQSLCWLWAGPVNYSETCA